MNQRASVIAEQLARKCDAQHPDSERAAHNQFLLWLNTNYVDLRQEILREWHRAYRSRNPWPAPARVHGIATIADAVGKIEIKSSAKAEGAGETMSELKPTARMSPSPQENSAASAHMNGEHDHAGHNSENGTKCNLSARQPDQGETTAHAISRRDFSPPDPIPESTKVDVNAKGALSTQEPHSEGAIGIMEPTRSLPPRNPAFHTATKSPPAPGLPNPPKRGKPYLTPAIIEARNTAFAVLEMTVDGRKFGDLLVSEVREISDRLNSKAHLYRTLVEGFPDTAIVRTVLTDAAEIEKRQEVARTGPHTLIEATQPEGYRHVE